MATRGFKPGDPVIFRKTKISTCPGPRAISIHPQGRGETYTYQVDKFWVVDQPIDGEMLLVRTRRGKVHRIRADDPNLRRANLLEWWLYRDRFPERVGALQ
jgi:hypothetical protein